MDADNEDQEEYIPYRLPRTPSELASIRQHLNSSTRPVHVTALDEVVSVNSFFTIAVFIGITLTSSSDLHIRSGSTTSDEKCIAGPNTFKHLVLYEVIAFSCFQFSSLVAHGLKLLMLFKHGKNQQRETQQLVVNLNHRLLRFAVLGSALGSIAGTTFLMLSLVNYVQLRFGKIICGDPWTVAASVPLITLVSTGIIIFTSSIVYAFLH